MKLWIPLALAVVILFAYALFYFLSAVGGQGGNSVDIVNMVGLASVVIGVIAAAFILRRSAPNS